MHPKKPPGIIRRAISGTGRAIANFWAGYTSFGQFFLTLAAIAIGVDAVICYNYGITQTFWHGAGFALLAVVIAVLPDAAASEWEKGAKLSAFAIGLGCIPLVPVAYQSHLGYSAGVRVADIRVTQAKMDVASDDRDSIDQARRDKASAEAAIARLKWLPTDVTASGIAAEISAKNEAIRQEKLKVKKGTKDGCGPNCQKLMNELAELEKRKGAIEDLSKEKGRLQAANDWLNKAKEKVASAETVNSTTVNQNRVASQLFNLMRGQSAADAINPDKVTETFVNTGISGANSLAFMLMAPLCWFVAGRNRRRKEDETDTTLVAHPQFTAKPSAPVHTITLQGAPPVFKAA